MVKVKVGKGFLLVIVVVIKRQRTRTARNIKGGLNKKGHFPHILTCGLVYY